MCNLTYFLTEYDLINLKEALGSIKEKYNAALSYGEASYLLYQHTQPIPSDISLTITLGETDRIAVSIIESSEKEYLFYLKKYRMTCSLSKGDIKRMREAIHRMVEMMKSIIPAEFVSMEHLNFHLKEPVEVNVTTLQRNLLISGKASLDAVFHGFRNRGEVRYLENRDRVPERIRLEVRENEFRYIDINIYRVYEKDGVIFAAAITRCFEISGCEVFSIHVVTGNGHSHRVTELFDGGFEDSLIGSCDIKGGKYTGDQKIIKLKEKVTFDDIMLESGVREKVKKEIFDFFKIKELYRKAGLPFKRGVALYGPPGTGKTMIAKIIACTMKETVIWVKAGDIATADDINRVFRLARMGKPSVVILEDIDFYTEDRGSASPNKIGIATLMSNLDGLEENDGIMVVVTTNRIEIIERAIIDRPGRIDSRIFIGELGRESIARLLQKKLGSFRRTFRNFLDTVPPHTVMTGAMVIELSTNIMRHVLARSGADTTDIEIAQEDVQKAIRDIVRMENRSKTGFAQAG